MQNTEKNQKLRIIKKLKAGDTRYDHHLTAADLANLRVVNHEFYLMVIQCERFVREYHKDWDEIFHAVRNEILLSTLFADGNKEKPFMFFENLNALWKAMSGVGILLEVLAHEEVDIMFYVP
jgi:hypothetical protein